MRKEVSIVVGNCALSAFQFQCVNVVGSSEKLLKLAVDVCPDFYLGSVRGGVSELWFYRGILIFKDCDGYLPFCVPLFRGRVGRFCSLIGAKAAVSRYLYRKEGGNL